MEDTKSLVDKIRKVMKSSKDESINYASQSNNIWDHYNTPEDQPMAKAITADDLQKYQDKIDELNKYSHHVTVGGGGGGGTGSYSGASGTMWVNMPSPVSIPYPNTNSINTISTIGTQGMNPNTTWTVGGLGPTGGTGAGNYGWTGNYQAPTNTTISVGSDFSISGPTKGNETPVILKYKEQTLDVGEMFSMFAAFKGLLKVVAKDDEFCKRHPEVAELAQGFLLEELKR
jgi:hypothetical protein